MLRKPVEINEEDALAVKSEQWEPPSPVTEEGDGEIEDEMSQDSGGEGGAEGHTEKKTKKKRKRAKLMEQVDNRGRKKLKTGNYENNHTGEILKTFHHEEMEAEEVEEQAAAETRKRTLEDIFEQNELQAESVGMFDEEEENELELDTIDQGILVELESSSDASDSEKENFLEEDVPKWSTDIGSWSPGWLIPFDSPSGPRYPISKQPENPIDYFELFFDENIINNMIEETWNYSQQFFSKYPGASEKNYYKGWNKEILNMHSIKAFIASLLFMGIVKLPTMRHHWKKSNLYNSPLKNIWSRDKFALFLKFFHLSNNEFDDKTDKIFKIRKFLLQMSEKFKNLYQLGKEIAIDEKMIKFTGSSKMKQFIKDKPTRWGFKVFVLADSNNGYVYSYKLYEGKENQPTQNLNSKIISYLVEGLQNKGHHLYMDSYYTNYKNIIELSKMMIGVTGTIRKNTKNMPSSFKKIKKLPQGNYECQRSGNLLCLIWQDRKLVRIVSNIHGPDEIQVEDKKKPAMIRKYNQFMGGVDRGDQFSSFYMHENRLVKWWMRIFIGLLDAALMNSYILYSYHHSQSHKMSQLEFREYIINGYFSKDLNSTKQAKLIDFPLSNKTTQHILKKRNQRNCCICSTSESRKTTIYFCVGCDKNVHPEKCFYILHNSEKIHKRDKFKNLL